MTTFDFFLRAIGLAIFAWCIDNDPDPRVRSAAVETWDPMLSGCPTPLAVQVLDPVGTCRQGGCYCYNCWLSRYRSMLGFRR